MPEIDTSTFLKVMPIVIIVGIFIGLSGRQILKKLLNNSGAVKAVCPIIETGGTPLTKEQHNELCAKNMEVVEGKFALVHQELGHIKDGVTRIEKHLNGGK